MTQTKAKLDPKELLTGNIREVGLIAVIIIIAIFVQIRSGGNFLTMTNLNDMIVETAVLAILAVGMMMVIITGGIDLSIGATMALSAMVSCTVLKYNPGLPVVVIVLVAIATGAVCGFVIGNLVSRLYILPIIATLGMMNVYRGSTYLVSNGGWILQKDMTKEFMGLATGKFLGINNLVCIAIVVYAAGYYFLNYTRKGRQIYAVGNSIESARVSGINTKSVLTLVYSLMGATAGLGGVLYVCKYAAAQGETATGYEMSVIAACVLGGVSISGGVGKVQGVLLGALLFGMLNNALPLIQVSAFWQEAIRGLLILFSILVNALMQRRVTQKALERRSGNE